MNPSQEATGKLNIIVFGAHPDDCDITAGGVAAKWAELGHHVRFVALTSGDNGHPVQAGGELAQRRSLEVKESARRLGIDDYEVLDNHGGELLPTLEMRRLVARKIRECKADIVMTPRPYDYHPDHRYTSALVQDAAYMVTVPYFAPSVPALSRNPVFLYVQDHFQRPIPFQPDIAVAIDDVIDKKVGALDAQPSQMYEWDPWMEGRAKGMRIDVPAESGARLEWLRNRRWFGPMAPSVREALKKWYGPKADSIRYAEAFEICEYGSIPSAEEIRRLFPFLPE